MQSLLGLFYNRIKGSQEDIASESLVYILNKSIKSRAVIGNVINVDTKFNFSDLSYTTQNVGDNLERPDISGIDEDGKEVLLIEAKFWASLTDNQPNGYLDRLKDDTVLIFLVPTLRVRVVFDEVLNRIKEKFTDIEVDIENQKIRIVSTNQYILIKNWNAILNTIKLKLLEEKDQLLISDVNQIIGFCDTIDNNSFQPIMDKDLLPSIPKQINSYYDVVDKVVDELSNQLKGRILILNRTSRKYGYHRYFVIGDLGFAVCVKIDLWEKSADTPFWLLIQEIVNEDWLASNEFKSKCKKAATQLNCEFVDDGEEVFISIKPLLNETEDNVISNIVDKINLIRKDL